jgi:hypothetical protein
MQALHAGKAQNDKSDAPKIAGRRRRMHRTRQRAALLPHLQQPHSQSTLPEIGQTLAAKRNRTGGAARFPAPAVPKSIAVALAGSA